MTSRHETAAATPRDLMFGKVLGIMLAGLAQLVPMLLVAGTLFALQPLVKAWLSATLISERKAKESVRTFTFWQGMFDPKVMLLALNLPLVGMWVKILQVPRHYLNAGILTFAAMGAFAVNFTPADVIVLVVIGVLGFFMRRYGYPIAPPPWFVRPVLKLMLKRYLRSRYDMSPEDYRRRWGLPADYPMVAPNYAEQRRALAKSIGLGTKRRKTRGAAAKK